MGSMSFTLAISGNRAAITFVKIASFDSALPQNAPAILVGSSVNTRTHNHRHHCCRTRQSCRTRAAGNCGRTRRNSRRRTTGRYRVGNLARTCSNRPPCRKNWLGNRTCRRNRLHHTNWSGNWGHSCSADTCCSGKSIQCSAISLLRPLNQVNIGSIAVDLGEGIMHDSAPQFDGVNGIVSVSFDTVQP